MNRLLALPSRSVRRPEYNSALYRRAEREAMRLNHEYVGLEHLFLAITAETLPNRLGECRRYVEEGPDRIRIGRLVPSPGVRAVMGEAIRMAAAEGRSQAEVEAVWQSLRSSGGEDAAKWARRLGLDLSREFASDA
jgi:Clp amino terminal domain, pathogenicity island component